MIKSTIARKVAAAGAALSLVLSGLVATAPLLAPTASAASTCNFTVSSASLRTSVWNSTCDYVRAQQTYRTPTGLVEHTFGSQNATFSQTAQILSPCTITAHIALLWKGSVNFYASF